MKKNILYSAIFALMATATGALAAVTADEAAALKSTLTPLGGEKAGNKDGSIPAWDGEVMATSGKKVGDVPVQLFAGEKTVVQISSKNMDQYADKLSDGTKALLKKYPDTFRVDVYPTHRTAVAPQYVYDNTFKNATNCKTKANGNSMEGCFGGIPFPIPKTGNEVIWNHQLRVEAEMNQASFKNIVATSDGSRTLATQNDIYDQYPSYYKDGSAEKWSGEYWLMRFNTNAPPFKSGEGLVFRDSIDVSQPRAAWQYLVGQRRVRRAPTVSYDTPDFVASGANYFDEVQAFMGAVDRFNWKIIGKKEIYIPYNANGFVTASENDAFAKNHMNPDKVRWELHRVWEVEATVAAGKRHAVPKRHYYFDEDTWAISLIDGYDAEGKLWRTTQSYPFYVPAIPAVVIKPITVFNLQAGTMSMVQSLNGGSYKIPAQRKPDNFYSGDAMGADASR
jgi:hypothetical protein